MKRRKLFYVPGIISLLVVPVFFYLYQPAVKKQMVLKIYVPKDDSESSQSMRFTRSAVTAALKDKKINTVYLDSNHKLNTRKLEFIEAEALKLKFYNDTTQVIKVHLSDETIYNEFIQLVNIMYKDLHKRYALLDNDFYIFGEAPPEPRTELDLPCLLCNDVIYIPKVKTWQERLREEINKYKSMIINNALLLSAFVLLIVIPALLKKKRGI